MQTSSSQPTPQTKIEFHKTHDYREEYANSVNLQVTTWDFQFTFGRMEQLSADLISINSFGRVYLSPQQAKALQQLLTANVEQYERSFGAIAIAPPGLVQPPAGRPQ
jgi:Protein of unknown function (DUF3467)